MPASELSPLGFALVAVCGGSAPDPADLPTSTGFSCNDYNLMIKVEYLVGRECVADEECEQIIPVDETCPTSDLVLSSDFDTVYLEDLIAEAEGEGCTVVYPGSRGDCDPEAEPVCGMGGCTWM